MKRRTFEGLLACAMIESYEMRIGLEPENCMRSGLLGFLGYIISDFIVTFVIFYSFILIVCRLTPRCWLVSHVFLSHLQLTSLQFTNVYSLPTCFFARAGYLSSKGFHFNQNHGGSTYPPLTYPPLSNKGFIKRLGWFNISITGPQLPYLTFRPKRSSTSKRSTFTS